MAVRRLNKELKDLENDPSHDISAGPSADDMFAWRATIIGPPNTPYEGGVFFLDIKFPQDYPFKAPRILFQTKIYHCNVNDKGGISIEGFAGQWSPALTVRKLLLAVRSMMTDPNPDDPLVPDIAKLYKSNRKLHDKTAREWAIKYAGSPANDEQLKQVMLH